MKLRSKSFVLLTVIAGLAGAAAADGHLSRELSGAMKARGAHMQLFSYNLGKLGAMAQEKAPYDAEAASVAASNLAALASVSQDGYWLEGTDTSVEGSRAKPDIWSDLNGFNTSGQALVTSSTALAAVAGDGLEALQAAFGPVGKSCGDCHETYRAPRN